MFKFIVCISGHVCMCACVCLVAQSHPTLFVTLWNVARQTCPWNFPDKNTRVDYHSLLQGIFPTQGSNPCLLHWQADSLLLSHVGSPSMGTYPNKSVHVMGESSFLWPLHLTQPQSSHSMDLWPLRCTIIALWKENSRIFGSYSSTFYGVFELKGGWHLWSHASYSVAITHWFVAFERLIAKVKLKMISVQ